MKKIYIYMAFIIISSLILTGCGGPEEELLDEPDIDYGTSAVFTQSDIDECISMVREQMDSWNIDYNIQRISYGGDDLSVDGLQYAYSLTSGEIYPDCMVLLVDFISLSDSKAYKKNKLYDDWEWIFLKSSEGEWMLFSNGHILDYVAG